MKFYIIVSLIIVSFSLNSFAECFGEGEYQVCVDSYTDLNGDIHIQSSDSEGNEYRVDTESYSTDDETSIRSYDSEGNEYEVKSWSDSIGIHSEDSEGNSCTITYSGETIGCD
jgi:hypothetical protein